ncbi:MAG: GAF domain-containing protein [Anaerolineales bacterium]|nr:GAF domain-containing protein [Anaerolineales bacterium]
MTSAQPTRHAQTQAGPAGLGSEAHWGALMESAIGFAIYRVAVDPNSAYGGRVVLVSPSLRDLAGIEDPYRFEAWFDNLHPDDLPRVREANRRAWQQGEPYDQVVRVYHPHRQAWLWVRTISHPVLDANGQPAYFDGMVVDVTAQQAAEQALQERLEFERLIASISTVFIDLGPEQVDTAIQHALRLVGEATAADRSFISLLSGDASRVTRTHAWRAAGAAPGLDGWQQRPAAEFPWLLERLKRREVVAVERVDDLPAAAAAEKALLHGLGLCSALVAPVTYGGSLAGFLGLESARGPRAWTGAQQRLLRPVGDILINALEHKRALAVQAGQRRFLELLAAGGDFYETLHTLVSLIEEQWPGMLGLILLLDPDGLRLHIGASASLPKAYVESIEGLAIGPQAGSCGTACYHRQRVIVEDIAVDPRWAGLRELGLQHGLRACWSQPVLAPDGAVAGTFAMYYRQPRAPTEAELSTIETAAHLVGVAIEHRRALVALQHASQNLEQRVQARTRELAAANEALRREAAEHRRTEAALHLSQALYAEVFENSPLQLFLIDVSPESSFRVITTNPAHQRGSGVSREQIEGKTLDELLAPEVAESVSRHYRDCVVAGQPIEYEESGPAPYWDTGRIRTFRTTLAPVRDQTGRIVRLVGASQDITEQKQDEAALARQAQASAVAAERDRLARDLHDAVTQTLFSASLTAEALPKLWERDPDVGRQRLEALRELTRGALAEMRTLLLELRPAALTESSLADLLRQLAQAIVGRAGVPIEVQVEGGAERAFAPEAQVALYRIAQEALNNVAKHANATRATVSLSVAAGVARLAVRDDGRGFEPLANLRDHLGLRIMRERAESIGATLAVESRPGTGTSVRVEWKEA